MILYFNKMWAFAYGDSSAINFDNPHLMHKTKVFSFFQPGYYFYVVENVHTLWVILYMTLK